MAIYLGWKFVPESPRWLLSRVGRLEESSKIFEQIANTNNMPLPKDLNVRLLDINSKILEEQENTYGYISLFTHWGLAKKTMLLCAAFLSSCFTYSLLSINLANMGGNTFFNLFILNIVEMPATYFSGLAAVIVA